MRESVLWFLRNGLEAAAERQRELVERRIERVREKERSVLYKASGAGAGPVGAGEKMREEYRPEKQPWSSASAAAAGRAYDPAISSSEAAEIENQLSAEQLQLFAEENDTMLRYYEDTLGKVQFVSFHPSLYYKKRVLINEQKRGKIALGNILASTNPCFASSYARGIYRAAGHRCRNYADEYRGGK